MNMTEQEFYTFLTDNQDAVRVTTAQALAADLGIAFYSEMVP